MIQHPRPAIPIVRDNAITAMAPAAGAQAARRPAVRRPELPDLNCFAPKAVLFCARALQLSRMPLNSKRLLKAG